MNWKQTLEDLENGKIRTANKVNGAWIVNTEIKEAILAAFRAGKLSVMGEYIDKDTLPQRHFSLKDNVRIVPTGSAVRTGAHLASGVIVMPPSYINVGAFVDSGTLVDSHVLVGSCAQVGKNVHLSAGVQIGGVLEPIGELPVIIEDNVFVGAGTVIVEGRLIKEYAVIAAGVVLSKGIPVYDCVNEKQLEANAPIPEGAVVVPGTRPLKSTWCKNEGLSAQCALIIKYRDDKSNASLVLEKILR